MFRLNKLTDYGIVLMAHVARSPEDTPHTARSLAKDTKLPLPTVGKLLRQLSDRGLLSSHRGVYVGVATQSLSLLGHAGKGTGGAQVGQHKEIGRASCRERV